MTRQVSPVMQEFKCPSCGATKVSFFPLNHMHDGEWVQWRPTKQEAPEPPRRGPGRPRKAPVEE